MKLKPFLYALLILLVVFIVNVGWIKYILILIGLAFLFYLGLVIHELGHLIGGLILGYKLMSLSIGPLYIQRQQNKLHLTINYRRVNYGQCFMKPIFTEIYEHERKKYMFYLFSGSLLNFFVVAICCALFLWSSNLIFIIFILSNISIALLALIPFKTTEGMYTDGLGILILLKNNLNSKVYYYLVVMVYKNFFYPEDVEELSHCIEQQVNLLFGNTNTQIIDTELLYTLKKEIILWHVVNKNYLDSRKWTESMLISRTKEQQIEPIYLASYLISLIETMPCNHVLLHIHQLSECFQENEILLINQLLYDKESEIKNTFHQIFEESQMSITDTSKRLLMYHFKEIIRKFHSCSE